MVPGATPEINSATVHSNRPAHGLQRFCSGLANENPREEREQKCPSARPGRQRSLSIIRLWVNSFVAQPEVIPGKLPPDWGGAAEGKRLSEARPAWRGSSTYSSLAPAALKSLRPVSPRLWTWGECKAPPHPHSRCEVCSAAAPRRIRRPSDSLARETSALWMGPSSPPASRSRATLS